MVIWLVGLSGAGKSTLGRELAKQLRAVKPNTVLLDGDELRKVFAHDKGNEPYTVQGRRINAERIVALCEMLDKQGIHVVCCILSIFPDMRLENRTRFSRYFEVFMDAPLEVLMARDVKGMYAAAIRGEVGDVVGIDIPFERPTGADITINTSNNDANIAVLASNILALAGLV